MRIYYAHSLSLYGTEQEKRDVKLLEDLGFEVENPNQKCHQEGYKAYTLKFPDQSPMIYFTDLVLTCDALAFRAFVDFKIGGGVFKEAMAAKKAGKPVIELPTLLPYRGMERKETVQYLQELGQR